MGQKWYFLLGKFLSIVLMKHNLKSQLKVLGFK